MILFLTIHKYNVSLVINLVSSRYCLIEICFALFQLFLLILIAHVLYGYLVEGFWLFDFRFCDCEFPSHLVFSHPDLPVVSTLPVLMIFLNCFGTNIVSFFSDCSYTRTSLNLIFFAILATTLQYTLSFARKSDKMMSCMLLE